MPKVLKCKFCSELLQDSDIEGFEDHLKKVHLIENLPRNELSNYYKVMIITEKTPNSQAPAFIKAGSFIGKVGVKTGESAWNWLNKKRTDQSK